MTRRERLPRFVPELVQTSAIDCGPVALHSLLRGHGVEVSYGRLRELCQTDLDGTSIDTMEDIAVELGLAAEQAVVPIDHLLRTPSRAFPSIVLTRQANGASHFVVLWSRMGGWLQVMDPASGRRWVRPRRFLDSVYPFTMRLDPAEWREHWAGSSEYQVCLTARIRELGIDEDLAIGWLDSALREADWRPIAALDAAVRLAAGIVGRGRLSPGREAAEVVASFFKGSRSTERGDLVVPPTFWPVHADGDALRARGAVLLRVERVSGETPALRDERLREAPASLPERLHERPASFHERLHEASASFSERLHEAPASLSERLCAAAPSPFVQLVRELAQLGPAVFVWATVASLGAAGVVLLEALLFRGLLGLGGEFLPIQRIGLIGVVTVVLLAGLLFEVPLQHGLARVGRHLECRMRIVLQRKIPRIHDRYFRSRPVSDMAERSHAIGLLRELPPLAGQLLRTAIRLLLTAIGLVWIDPARGWLVALAVAVSLVVPLLGRRFLGESELRVRSHLGALGKFYLDALLGVVPIRLHGAGPAVRSEHESLLTEWARAGFGFHRVSVWVKALQMVVTLAVVFALVAGHAAAQSLGPSLLFVYWALGLPALGEQLAQLFIEYPIHRNVLLRVLEPLGAPEEVATEETPRTREPALPTRSEHAAEASVGVAGASRERPSPVAIRFDGVCVDAAGRRILDDLDLAIEPGEQIALVGRSGSGKSTLLGLLLGWSQPSQGCLSVDGVPLAPTGLAALRARTVWVDPTVQLWNRPLLANLAYGNEAALEAPGWDERLGDVLVAAHLLDLVEALPEGIATPLGESGGLVSGGEGQRVRIGRAMLRADVGLVLFDEAFRGVPRDLRAALLAEARSRWPDATFLHVTHDLDDVARFDRVVVLEEGRIVFTGPPSSAVDDCPEYAALRDGQRALRTYLADGSWRRWRMEDGRLCTADANDPGGRGHTGSPGEVRG